jgi:N-acyl-D-amino-acid deacylase
MRRAWTATGALFALAGCAEQVPERPPPPYDVVIRGGTIYDGSGGAPYSGDVALKGDRIAYVGQRRAPRGAREIDARGLAVSPGFINMLSWSNSTLIVDGRGQSAVRQGVTLEVMGEGTSMGPLTAAEKAQLLSEQDQEKYDISWTTLGEYLEHLERRGVSPNVASFVGATTVRVHELGRDNVDPTPEQLRRMRTLVRQAMDEGAMGVGSSLVYVPAAYAGTEELVALASEADRCGGMYISHIRDEGSRLIQAIDELIDISRRSGARAEVYHLKATGQPNWPKMRAAIARIEAARADGLPITADMYLYTATATGLDTKIPLWIREGGHTAMMERLKQPRLRARAAADMRARRRGWSSMQPAGFRNPALRIYAGKRLPEIARMRGTSIEATVLELILEDDSRVGTIFHLMSEDNVRKGLVQPWMSFGSDAAAVSAEPPHTNTPTHPRAYGNFARLLGRYVREEKLLELPEAIRKLSALPAANLRIADRGQLKRGFYADIAIFDPTTIADRATFEDSHQYAVGMRHVLVNGTPVIKDGEHTGAKPGRVVRGPGWRRCK